MTSSKAKENILKKIRQALTKPVPLPFPESESNKHIYKIHPEDVAVTFAEEFTRLQGRFAFCSGLPDLEAQLRELFREKGWQKIFYTSDFTENFSSLPSHFNDLEGCDASITGCECLVARTGTIVLSAAQAGGRTASVYAPVHICIAYTDQLVYDISDGLGLIKQKYQNNIPSFITFASGPSRTADIEKTLVTGVHGPKEVYCFLVDLNPIS